MRFIDPDGMDAVDVNGGVMYTGDDAKNAYIQLQKNRPKQKDGDDKDKKKKDTTNNVATVATDVVAGSIALTKEGMTAFTMDEIIALGTIALRWSPLGFVFLMEGDTPHRDIAIPDVETDTDNKKRITLFRGVNPTYMAQYLLALQGIAIPIGGNASPREHSLGNTQSIYTSWSTDPNVAAWRGGVSGVILKTQMIIGDPRLFPNVFSKYPGEKEFLIIGPVAGAEVLKSWGTGTWNPTQIK